MDEWVEEMAARFGWFSPMSERSEMHLARVKIETVSDMDRKYRAGHAEHGDDLLDMDTLRLIDEAISEATDQIVYLRTLRDRFVKERKK